MNAFESFSKERSTREKRDEIEPATIDDFAGSPQIQIMLRRLPAELQGVHASRISDLSEEQAFGYMHALLEKRESALRESVVSEKALAPYFQEHQQEIWNDLETKVFTDTNNFLGSGQTAQVKRYDLKVGEEKTVSMAVKYLLTPTQKTLSVSGEHDLIKEVERVRAIEKAEELLAPQQLRIRVPHPYFYYKNGKTQCYGMERIEGITLEQGITGELSDELRADLKRAFATVDSEALKREVEQFFDAMHTICLHGDIKPGNIMVSQDGHFYVIDFGQSYLANDINDTAREAFEVLKQDEKDGTNSAMHHFLRALED